MKNLSPAHFIVCIVSVFVLASCFSPDTDGSSVAGTGPWPQRLHIAAPGRSGLAKYVSWTSMMEADTGMVIRVVPQADHRSAMEALRTGEMLLSSGSKTVIRDLVEARGEYAAPDSGPFPIRITWVHDLANSGFFVRGDSSIQTLYDIGPGTRLSVWNESPSTLNPYRALLAWAQVEEEDISWVNAGSFEGAMRAVSEGRADVAFGFPTSPIMTELAAAPRGIRFLNLNAVEDPTGAARWQTVAPLYSFGPITTGLQEAIGTWGTEGYIFELSAADSDEMLIYNIAKWLHENYENYASTYASNKYMSLEHLMRGLETTYIPVHDGLIRYLRELELWTPQHEQRQRENIAMLELYQNSYAEAVEIAAARNIEVSPANSDWISFWETFKLRNNIPKIGQHISLTVSAEPNYPTADAITAASDDSDDQ